MKTGSALAMGFEGIWSSIGSVELNFSNCATCFGVGKEKSVVAEVFGRSEPHGIQLSEYS